ncbi:MAG: flagellin [Pirellulaceae bacterium]
MSLVIANNVSSITAQNNLARSSKSLGKSLERLSSGLKVNRGADGPAALVISEKQRAQIVGIEQAIENANKGVTVVQTAEGALNEISTLLNRARGLALDAANSGVNDADALAANQAEIDNALDTINRIANNTQFANKKLLDGSAGYNATSTNTNVDFVRANSSVTVDNYSVEVVTQGQRAVAEAGTLQTTTLAADEIVNVNGVAIELNQGMDQDAVVKRINEYTSETGVTADKGGAGGETRLYSRGFGSANEISVVSNVVAAADSSGIGIATITGQGVDVVASFTGSAVGAPTVNYTGDGNVVTADSGVAKGLTIRFAEDGTDPALTVGAGADSQAIIALADDRLTFQIGPNAYQTASIGVDKANPDSLGVGVEGNKFTSLAEISVLTDTEAQDSIAVIDAAIDEITNLRGALGAFQQNTLESTASNLQTTLENSVAAESVIRDTDFASEIANFTKQQVLVQAGTSILSNANQTSQLVLSLL